jgi:TolB-like protein/class 3 adenylate cyclase/Tfp pilus assembly protein PilF
MSKTNRPDTIPAPSGTITFLFTDIEGSTPLWEAQREAMRSAVARHDELMRQCIAARDGHVFKTVGDAFCAAFPTAPQAVSAALSVQQAMQAELWPEALPIRVRVALHTGAAEARDDDYFGPPLNHVARLLAIAHGGQTLVSEITRDLCGDHLPVGSTLKPLGEHGLKGVARREALFELCHPGLASSFPPLRTAASPAPDDIPSIAVLPFVNMSRDEENEYFADGLSEELLNVLANIRGLRVPSRTSAFFFKGKDVDLRTVAQNLNVATILEGSVRKSGKRVRITAQLIRVATDTHLWSRTYDRELDDIFAVQDDIAHSVVSELRAALLGERGAVAASADAKAEIKAAAKGRGENAEAYRLYLQARFFEERPSQEDVERAIDYYKQALAIDPAYALAWAGLARANTNQAAYYAQHVDGGFRNGREAAERALQLQPDLAEAHEALGRIQMWYDRNWEAADASYRRALELAPDNVHVARSAAQLANCLGRADEAIRMLRRAATFDPLSAPVQRSLASACVVSGDLDGAEAAARKGIELNPKGDLTHAWLAVVRHLQGRLDEALEEFRKEPSPIFRLQGLAIIHHARGESAASDAALQELTAIGSEGAAFQIAEVHAERGDADAAFEWLERAYAQKDSGLPMAMVSVPLRNVHADARWPRFLARLRLTPG